VPLDTDLSETLAAADSDIEQIAEALEVLDNADPRLRQVVEMRYFGGMTDGEIGEVLGVTARTVGRDWERARLLFSVALKP
jgi:RNA polymerase sigma factor (sigma-70 family)